jgi:hypothetical protein
MKSIAGTQGASLRSRIGVVAVMATWLVIAVSLIGCTSPMPGPGYSWEQRQQKAQWPEEQQVSDTNTAQELQRVRSEVLRLGSPRAFSEVWDIVQSIPRFKDEFETTAAFSARQMAALSTIESTFLIEAPIDMEYVEYDADREILSIVEYAFTNTVASSDELMAVFGYSSELHEQGIEIDYGILGGSIAWMFPRETETTGAYVGSNALGASVEVAQQTRTAFGVFERRAKHGEDLWHISAPPQSSTSAVTVFRISADPARAKRLEKDGLRAALLVSIAPPYFATGTTSFQPTLSAPYDRKTHIMYLIGDIRAAALYDSDGEMLAVCATR